MASYRLEQAVKPGDLILAWAPGKTPYMLLVESIVDDKESSADPSSIIVVYVHSRIPAEHGYWMLDGPNVVYYDEIHEEGKKDFENPFLKPLSSYLQRVNPAEAGENASNPDTNLIVNPHGRDVLTHYFNRKCPQCSGSSWICPGCGGVSSRWPEHFASCGYDLSCPYCMGYDFALEDKITLQNLDTLYEEGYLLAQMESSTEEDRQRLQQIEKEWLSGYRERYERVNARREEMGYPLNDVEELMKRRKECFDFVPVP